MKFKKNFHYFLEEKKEKIEEKISSFKESYPDSPLIQYHTLTNPEERRDKEKLEEFLQEHPQYTEIHFFLGEMALERRQLLQAEKNYLKVYEEIPQSTAVVISLASVYMALEEFQKSLSFYDECLQLIPTYRDALLGKAICLSHMEEYEQALGVLQELIELGKYYMGEAHYWLAWNQNELGRLEKAWENIEKTQKYIIGESKIPALAGVISFKQKKLEVAEKKFKKALDLDRSTCLLFPN